MLSLFARTVYTPPKNWISRRGRRRPATYGNQVRMVVREQKASRRTQTLKMLGLPSGTYFLRLTIGGRTRPQKLTTVR